MLWQYKSAAPRLIVDGNRSIALRPLSRFEIDSATERARQQCDVDGPAVAAVFDLCLACEIIQSAACDPRDGSTIATGAHGLTAGDVDFLMGHWIAIQQASCPDYALLEAYLELQVADGDDTAAGDCYRAHQCQTAMEFYGSPALHLTDGQLLYFFAARSVYQLAFGETPEGKRRCRNLSLIRSRAEKLSALQTTSAKSAA